VPGHPFFKQTRKEVMLFFPRGLQPHSLAFFSLLHRGFTPSRGSSSGDSVRQLKGLVRSLAKGHYCRHWTPQATFPTQRAMFRRQHTLFFRSGFAPRATPPCPPCPGVVTLGPRADLTMARVYLHPSQAFTVLMGDFLVSGNCPCRDLALVFTTSVPFFFCVLIFAVRRSGP